MINAVDLDWIGAVDQDGRWHRVSARTLLDDPDSWACLHDPYPMRTVAAWRHITALHLAANGTSIDAYTRDMTAGGLLHESDPHVDAALRAMSFDDYTRTWAHRLDPTSDTEPFAQAPELEPGGSVAVIDPVRASGNAALLWDHTTADQRPAYTPAEAIAAALTLHTCTGSGLTGAAPGSSHRSGPIGPHGARVAAIPYAPSIEAVLDTITAEFPIAYDDRPAWEHPLSDRHAATGKRPRTPTGVLDWLTWAPRAVGYAWDGGHAVAAAIAPGRDLDPDWPRLYHDPFALPSPKEKDGPQKVMHVTQIGSAGTVLTDYLPPHWAALAARGPLRLRLIGQHTTQAQIDGHTITDHIIEAP